MLADFDREMIILGPTTLKTNCPCAAAKVAYRIVRRKSKQADTVTQEGTMPAQKGRRTQEMLRGELRTGKGGEVHSAGVIVFSVYHHRTPQPV